MPDNSVVATLARYAFIDLGYLADVSGAPVYHVAELADLYRECTAAERRRIFPIFDVDYYLANNLDVRHSGFLPLEHFLTVGIGEWRNPHPLIDLRYIAEQRPDLFAGKPSIELLLDCLDQNLADPSPFFSIAEYNSQLAGEPASSALVQYLETGAELGSRPNPFFDPQFYRKSYPDVPRSGWEAFCHFLERGDREQRVSSLAFDPFDYLETNDDVAAGAMGPLEHYLRIGRFQNRIVRPLAAPAEAIAKHAATTAIRPEMRLAGFVDGYSYHNGSSCWLFWGWVPKAWAALARSEDLSLKFEYGDVEGYGTLILYRREDVLDKGLGFVAYLAADQGQLGRLLSIAVRKGAVWAIDVTRDTALYSQEACTELLTELLPNIDVISDRSKLLEVITRRGYGGADTLERFRPRVFFTVDEIILCPTGSAILMGWYLAKPGAVRDIRLRCGPAVVSLAMEQSIRMPRPDVLSSLGTAHGFSDEKCGFMLRVDDIVIGNSKPYIEIEMANGEVAYCNLPQFRLAGLPAIQRILGELDCGYENVDAMFDDIIGPGIERINQARLATPPSIEQLEFGDMPPAPRFSIIVPLYGRIDYLEYQMGLFSQLPANAGHEFIYVLDDPPKRRELIELSASVARRFEIPFRLVILGENVGFAPANNIAASLAHGRYVCFLNSDVFPGTPDWIERLGAHLHDESPIGAVAPRLIYEDGSIQHEGMELERLPEFGNWYFPMHVRKGQRPRDDGGVHFCYAITAACMMTRRDTLEKLGGFAEAFAIGDFEDADFCMKIRELGLECAVDKSVVLYHLERKSQAAAGLRWRMNLTLYNAWIYQRRWAERLHQYRPEGPSRRPRLIEVASQP